MGGGFIVIIDAFHSCAWRRYCFGCICRFGYFYSVSHKTLRGISWFNFFNGMSRLRLRLSIRHLQLSLGRDNWPQGAIKDFRLELFAVCGRQTTVGYGAKDYLPSLSLCHALWCWSVFYHLAQGLNLSFTTSVIITKAQRNDGRKRGNNLFTQCSPLNCLLIIGIVWAINIKQIIGGREQHKSQHCGIKSPFE